MSIEGFCPECGHHTEELTKDGICIDCYCELDHRTKRERSVYSKDETEVEK